MTPALKAMVEAMAAEWTRQEEADERPVDPVTGHKSPLATAWLDDDGRTLSIGVEGGCINLEKVARAGLATLNALPHDLVLKVSDPYADLPTSQVTYVVESVLDEILKETL